MYRLKYYWEDGDRFTYVNLSWKQESKVFLACRKLFGEYPELVKIDVYENNKLIATFYK